MSQLGAQIRAQFLQLSPKERRVASFILDHMDDLATYNSVEISRCCGVSKSTVSRLFRRLGYDSFREMRDENRRLRQSGVPVPAVLGGGPAGLVERQLQCEADKLGRLMALLSTETLNALTARLAGARRVGIIGFRNSYPVALHLRQQLMQVREGVRLLPQPGQTLAEELADFGEQDVLILVAFHRRPMLFPRLFATIRRAGIPLALMIEPQAELAQEPDWRLEIPLDSVSAFDSYSAAMCTVSLLSNLLLHRSLEQGRERIGRINDLYRQTEELDPGLG
ncbi:MurR/RpiR family transcriptional regulator [Zobellella endophytica]|uniref:MurR/RpiR family transcriptional regulator n=1 Tax=Zobellella endophytica TaxID=2116700 RepID=A0A2P7R2G3_9GAMM|nr:MurR/RpiR family transcriptional regulator [Zobellella endophytica]PSJ44410.1 MurR/RpiR family transcriptional regulator [Zobellella endophytica]